MTIQIKIIRMVLIVSQLFVILISSYLCLGTIHCVNIHHLTMAFVLFVDVITCLSLDDDGHHLITGSRDSTCRLWGITHQGGVAQELIRTPLQTLYGHDKPITCVAMSWELDMAVSGSQVNFSGNVWKEWETTFANVISTYFLVHLNFHF